MKKQSVLFDFIVCLLLFANSHPLKAGIGTKPAPIDTSKFVLVQGGTFKMGTDEPLEKHESPAHSVTVKSFYLAKTEVTFEDFDKFCADTKRDTVSANGWGRGKQPLIYVKWFDAIAYCNYLSEKEKLSKCYLIKGTDVIFLDTAKGYRLPTEAEWEFAARGGNKTHDFIFSGSKDQKEVGWMVENSESRSHIVAQKLPNELGLYDMTGNVWEWVNDGYDGGYYQTSPVENPKGPESSPYKVMRGGAWYNYWPYCKVVTRQYHSPEFWQNSVGFRVARNY